MSPRFPDRYEFLAVLWRSETTAVYKVRHRLLDRVVALKTLAPGLASLPDGMRLLHCQGRLLAAVSGHPNVVALHEIFGTEESPCLVMEFVDGGSLAGALDGKPWPARRAAALIEALGRAAQAVHERGFVHGAICPDHILLRADGRPKLAGFGAAWPIDRPDRRGPVGAVRYTAPEVVLERGGRVGPGPDIYSLGAVLYELLTGRPPFQAAASLRTLRRVIEFPPVPPSRLKPGLPSDLESVCVKCLEKRPE